MLHIENIKFTMNNGLELPAPLPRATNAQPEQFSSSPAGFFNILKNQLQADRQFGDPFAIRQETPKYENPVSVNDAEKRSRESSPYESRTREETAAAGRVDEQGQKAALRNQTKETDNADDAKKASASRPDSEHQAKKTAAGETESGRIRRERKEKKQGEPDMSELLGGLTRMIDFLKGKEQPEIRNVKLAAQELRDLLVDMKSRGDRNGLKKAFEKLSAAIQKLELRAGLASPAEQLAGVLAGLKAQHSKMKEAHDGARHGKAAAAQDSPVIAVKELLVQLEAALDASRNDGAGRHSGGDAQGNREMFGFSQVRSEAAVKHADAQAGQRTNTLFRENLEQMIQNAKVSVKDGQNASFSMRLYPRELGSVNVSLSLSDGVVIGKFLVETQEAKDLLTQSLDHIRQQLSDSGVQVGGLQVDVNDRRGELLGDRDAERSYVIAPAEQAVEIKQEYAANAMSYHDGHINVVI